MNNKHITDPQAASAPYGQRVLNKPYLVFLGACADESDAKTGIGINDWSSRDVVGQRRFPECAIDLGVPDLTQQEATAQGARSFVIGVAPVGGRLMKSWRPEIIKALEAGLDIVSGLHDRLGADPEFSVIAAANGCVIHDVRRNDSVFNAGNGKKRAGLRLLTVGTDCALGKKYTALRLAKSLTDNGAKATFRATGQTGIMIAGAGVAIDAVISDFVAGAAEALTPDNDPDHWDIIEGQGALFHPAYAGVTLGLLHGSQPDALVLCHDPVRKHIASFPDYPLPSLEQAARRYVEAARLTNASAQIVGVSLNTSKLDDRAAQRAAQAAEDELNVPAMDPMRFGVENVVQSLMRGFHGRS